MRNSVNKYPIISPLVKLSFKCIRCADCCKNMKLVLNPIDIERLCGRLNINTTRFHEKYTSFEEGNNRLPVCLLNTKPECLFYNGKCRVYDIRPLVCRLHPLGAYSTFDKMFYFKINDCSGFRTNNKTTISGFIAENNIDDDAYFISRWEMISNIKAENVDEEFRESFTKLMFFFDSRFSKSFVKENNIENYPFQDKILFFIDHLMELAKSAQAKAHKGGL